MLSATLLFTVQPVQAQDTQTAPIPNPLPSVNGYSLPPGPSAPVENQVEGPVDENAPPPQRISPAPVAPAQTGATQPEIPAESRNRPPAPSVESGPSRANQRVAPSGEPIAGRAVPAPAPTLADANIVADPPETSSAPAIEPLAPPEQPITSPDEPDSTASPGRQSERTPLFLIGAGIALLLIGAIGLLVWRRRRVRAINDAEPSESPVPLESPEPAPSARQPSDGFVTSKIRTNARQVETPQPPPFTNYEKSEHLRIDFIAEKASTTLLNAVLSYRITLTNQSDEEMSNIRLLGTMMQADENAISNSAAFPDTELHQIPRLKAGESTIIAGELRLALSTIYPFKVQERSLFIPLARFGVEYSSEESAVRQQTATYIIGREHQPPRPKMAPFRLDLGPRNFNPVGQRPLATS